MLVNYLHFLLFALFFSECLEECAIAQTLENCLTKSFSQPSPSFRFCSWIDAFTRCVCVLSGCVPLSLRLVLRCCCRAGSTESSSSFFRTPDTQYLSCKQRHGCEILPTSHALFHWKSFETQRMSVSYQPGNTWSFMLLRSLCSHRGNLFRTSEGCC